jgi:hypothetical protein
MLEPRDAPAILRAALEERFLGGTENFDLWFRAGTAGESVKNHEYPLRIHRVAGGSTDWDMFKLPLHMNVEINASMEPASRIVGYWKDVTLSAEDVQIIEAYLQCFAPGVLGGETNDA